MLKNAFLGGVSFRPFYAPENEGGAAPDQAADAAAAAQAAAGDDSGGAADASGNGAAAAPDTGAQPPADGQQQRQPTDWKDKEIGRKHAQLQEERRKRQELEETNARLERLLESRQRQNAASADAGQGQADAPPATTAPQRPGVITETEEQRKAAINEAAQRLSAQQQFERDCQTVEQKAIETYGKEWDEARTNLKMLGGFDLDTMSGILATDDPSKILYELGKNPAEYQRVMELPPAKRLAEFVKMAIPKPGKTVKPSEAPAPVDTVAGRGNRGGVNLYDPAVDDETWYAERQRQKRERYEARQNRGRAA